MVLHGSPLPINTNRTLQVHASPAASTATATSDGGS